MSFSYAFLTQFDSWCMAATWHVFFQLFSLLICIEYPLQGTRELKKLTLWLMFFSLMLATNLLLRIQALPLACSYASFCCNEALGIKKHGISCIQFPLVSHFIAFFAVVDLSFEGLAACTSSDADRVWFSFGCLRSGTLRRPNRPEVQWNV